MIEKINQIFINIFVTMNINILYSLFFVELIKSIFIFHDIKLLSFAENYSFTINATFYLILKTLSIR